MSKSESDLESECADLGIGPSINAGNLQTAGKFSLVTHVDDLMRHLAPLPFLFVALSASACGVVGGGMQAGGVSPNAASASYVASPAVANTLRAQEKQALAVSRAAADADEEQLERKVQHALRLALGLEGVAPGMAPPAPSSATIVALRAAGLELRIVAMTNIDGNALADNLVMLKDSFTERVPVLQQKVMAHSATPAEMRELQSGVNYVSRLNDLKMQVSAISMVAMQTNTRVQIGNLTDMRMIASMVESRKQHGLTFTDDDWAAVQGILGRERRTQALAASTLGMLAVYEAVVSQQGDPKALDVIAQGTLDSFPLDSAASVEDAKAYVQNLAGNAAEQKAKYESWMRTAYGDDKYEKQYKAGIDRVFDHAGQAGQTKSIAQLQTDTMSRYNADLTKCARGEPLPPGSMVGPAKCKEARGQGSASADVSGGGAAPRSALTSSGTPLPSPVEGRMGQIEAGVQAAKAIANGDLQGTLDAATNIFPGDGPIQSSIKGVAALTHGDWKTALTSAVSLAPGGALVKRGLGTATQLLKLF